MLIAPVLVLGAVALLRCPSEQIPEVIKAIFGHDVFTWAGWIVAVMLLVGSLVLYLLTKRTYEEEIARLVKERNWLQEKTVGHVEHSEPQGETPLEDKDD